MIQLNEKQRLALTPNNHGWKKWGPYLSERQWGTVREDYSQDSMAWTSTTHEQARAKAYRWGEEGIGGICDNKGRMCMAFAFWNHKDPFLKERIFGLSNPEGNHGEDVKELYWYLDSTPTHSYMKMLYKYPQTEFPYQKLREENRKRTRDEPEYEILDTQIFKNNQYFDIFIEYTKAHEEDILVKLTIHNRYKEEAPLTILPTLWFRNTWSWGYKEYDFKPTIEPLSDSIIELIHKGVGRYKCYFESPDDLVFCDNETNYKTLHNFANDTPYTKDGINDFIISQQTEAINRNGGTKVSAVYHAMIPAGGSRTIKLRLTNSALVTSPFQNFDTLFEQRQKEANEFYDELQKKCLDEDLKKIQRQSYAGLLWSKQFYYYDVEEWLKGDPKMPLPSDNRKYGRNAQWKHLSAANIISMPDKWEYPWFASWDLAFHAVPLARLDPNFAKRQLEILLREYYMHPNGQIPAYEWSFSDVNPPIHAWATWKVYEIEKEANGGFGDINFLEKIFHKLLLNFTWWVNQKDTEGNNVFGGGFLGLDNIGIFDRSSALPEGGRLEQADGTGWMAMYTLNMLRIACEISLVRPVYQDMASKFFEHFLHIARAMETIGGDEFSLWNEEDQFYYDMYHSKNGGKSLKIRSLVGLIPLFAVEILDQRLLDRLPLFKRRVEWVLSNHQEMANLVSRWYQQGKGETRLLSILRGKRMTSILKRVFDFEEFLSDFGIRSLSKFHEKNPYRMRLQDQIFEVKYNPKESDSTMFGGNSNWRGPIWVQMNYILIDSLLKFSAYYDDTFIIEVRLSETVTKSLTLKECIALLNERLLKIFQKNAQTKLRPCYDKSFDEYQNDEFFKDYIQFYEYFDGDYGTGLGASHQTGWTGVISELIEWKEKLS